MTKDQINNASESLEKLAENVGSLASSITPSGMVAPGTDASGVTVTSLTEAVMGITAGLVRLSESVDKFTAAYVELHLPKGPPGRNLRG